jgi:hypothetical protein
MHGLSSERRKSGQNLNTSPRCFSHAIHEFRLSTIASQSLRSSIEITDYSWRKLA